MTLSSGAKVQPNRSTLRSPAGFKASMVLDAQGRVSGTIHVRDVIAKKRGGRRIPMHPDLALRQYRRTAYDEKLHPRFDGAARRPRHAQGEGDGALMSSWAI